jgi:hypothetical protein
MDGLRRRRRVLTARGREVAAQAHAEAFLLQLEFGEALRADETEQLAQLVHVDGLLRARARLRLLLRLTLAPAVSPSLVAAPAEISRARAALVRLRSRAFAPRLAALVLRVARGGDAARFGSVLIVHRLRASA